MTLWSQSVSVREEWAGCVSDLMGRRPGLRAARFDSAGVREYVAFACHLVFIVVYCSLILTFKVVNVGWVVLLRGHQRYVKWQMERQLRLMSFIPTGGADGSSRMAILSTRPGSASSRGKSKLTGTFFTLLPPEIRRRILMFAFGGRTLHMDISLRASPWQTPASMSEWRALYPPTSDQVSWHHAGIITKSYRNGLPSGHRRRRMLIPGQRKWQWFSCVCHRFPAWGPDRLPLGRRKNHPWSRFYEPNEDLCLKGGGCCESWQGGEWPGPCLVGVTGFMYSCREAYIEAMEILYRTNTIHIASVILLRRFQGILSPRVVESITSLELVWNSRLLRFEDGFTGMSGQSKTKEQLPPSPIPLFPALQYLRISFIHAPWSQAVDVDDVNHALGLPFNERDRSKTATQLHEYTLPAVDVLMDRIAPAEAEVTVSCPSWEWYRNIDLKLVEIQGLKETRLCRSEMEGLKCWRIVPREDKATPAATETSITPADLEEGSARPKLREGYWVHIPVYEVSLVGELPIMPIYDERRHDLYDLGPTRYGPGRYGLR